jgi:hypothetical protein
VDDSGPERRPLPLVPLTAVPLDTALVRVISRDRQPSVRAGHRCTTRVLIEPPSPMLINWMNPPGNVLSPNDQYSR